MDKFDLSKFKSIPTDEQLKNTIKKYSLSSTVDELKAQIAEHIAKNAPTIPEYQLSKKFELKGGGGKAGNGIIRKALNENPEGISVAEGMQYIGTDDDSHARDELRNTLVSLMDEANEGYEVKGGADGMIYAVVPLIHVDQFIAYHRSMGLNPKLADFKAANLKRKRIGR